MQRIPSPQPDQMTPRQREVHDAIAGGPRGGVRGPFTVLLNRPELADRVQALGKFCRYDSALEPRLSELAILVVAGKWSCGYERYAHEPIALAAGVEADVIAALREGRTPSFADAESQAVYDLVQTLQTGHAIDAATYAEGVRVLGETRVIDLVGIAGYYTLLAMVINAFEVEAPAASQAAQ